MNRRLVKMYVCGPTVYDYTHIGHARTYVAFDAIKRYLSLRGYNIVHVQNITDIDDKIINRAREEGRDWQEIVEEFSKDYLDNLAKLRVYIDIHPRVTHHIREIIEFIEGLIEKGHAYIAPSGSVYFDVSTYGEYGLLSGRFHPEQWRQEEDILREKRNPYDFALWKAWKPGEPYWDAPWGRGRPGWHIECSVMSSRYLGNQFDIHGGGQDLIFPHHENERAQSEAYFGVKPWVKYWLHTGYLTIHGEKMSKSLGNIIPLREAISKWGANTLRLWLLSAHYRTQLDFTENALEQAAQGLKKIRQAYQDIVNAIESFSPLEKVNEKEMELVARVETLRKEFHEALSNDFNTAKALATIYGLIRLINSQILVSESYIAAIRAYKLILEFNHVFAVLDDLIQTVSSEQTRLVNELIDLVVKVRQQFRERREYETADWIRNELAKFGIMLYDYPDGRTIWRILKRE